MSYNADFTGRLPKDTYPSIVNTDMAGGIFNSTGSRIYFVELTSSWATRSISSSWAPFDGTAGTILVTGSTYPITSSWAEKSITSSYALNGGGSGTILNTGSTYPFTSSWAEKVISASYAPFTQTIQTTVASASWVSASVRITTSDTASYYGGSVISASYAPTNTGYSASVSSQLNAKQPTLVTGDTYTITSSWANNVISASYALRSTSASYALTSSEAIFAPVAFEYVRIVDGKLLIRSSASLADNWYSLTVYDDGAGSFTTQLELANATGSMH